MPRGKGCLALTDGLTGAAANDALGAHARVVAGRALAFYTAGRSSLPLPLFSPFRSFYFLS